MISRQILAFLLLLCTVLFDLNFFFFVLFVNKESVYDNLEVQIAFDSLHDRAVSSKSKTMQRHTSGTYFHKKMIEQQQLYETNALRDEKKYHLGK